MRPTHLDLLEAEAIHILRDGVAEARNPVILFSGGKDSTVLAHLAVRAFHPGRCPAPLLHIDSTYEFRDVLAFRDRFAKEHGFSLVVHRNEAGFAQGINPFEHGDLYTTTMRTEALKQALNEGGYDMIFGGARRDEEASRAKERVVSVRNASPPCVRHVHRRVMARRRAYSDFPASGAASQAPWCAGSFTAARPAGTRRACRAPVACSSPIRCTAWRAIPRGHTPRLDRALAGKLAVR